MDSKSKSAKNTVVSIIHETTKEVTDIMDSISDNFENKQYHLIIYHLDKLKKVIRDHETKINLICFQYSSFISDDIINDYKQGNKMLTDRFTYIHDNVLKDVITCYNLDGNEFH